MSFVAPRGTRLLVSVFLGELLALLTFSAIWHGPVASWSTLDLATWGVAAVAVLTTAGVTWTETASWAVWRTPGAFACSWLTFPLLRWIHDAGRLRDADALLRHADVWIWGGLSLPARWVGVGSAMLSDALALAYLSFFALVLIPVGLAIRHRHGYRAQAFLTGLVGIYAFGFMGYVTWPAEGPFWAFPKAFPYPPAGGALTQTLVHVVHGGITGMDTFPSLHSAITVYVWAWAWSLRAWKSGVLLTVLLVGIEWATLHFAYHYGVDLIVGLMLGLLAWWQTTNAVKPKHQLTT